MTIATEEKTQEKKSEVTGKPYQFKKDKEIGRFKTYKRGTDELFEGFEDKDFGSPLEGLRFMSSYLKSLGVVVDNNCDPVHTVDVKEVAKAISETSEPIKEVKNDGFQIPVIEGKEPFIDVIGKTRFYEVVIREHNDTKRKSEPITDGLTTTYHVALGKPVILPEAVINTAKEAVYTIVHTTRDEATNKVINTRSESERFSVEIKREVPADEAHVWLKEQRKSNINIFA